MPARTAPAESPATDDAARMRQGTVSIANNDRKGTMKSARGYSSFDVNTTPIILGVALIGAGMLMGITGILVGGTALASATRKWVNDLDVPPSEVVKHKWHQTKAATTAGASAWQQHNGMQKAHA
jgi:hypothetical protein